MPPTRAQQVMIAGRLGKLLCIATTFLSVGCSPRDFRDSAVQMQDRAAQLGGEAELRRSLTRWEREGGSAETSRLPSAPAIEQSQPSETEQQSQVPNEFGKSGPQNITTTPAK